MSHKISGLNHSAGTTGTAATHVLDAVARLSTEATPLESAVSEFIGSVRAA